MLAIALVVAVVVAACYYLHRQQQAQRELREILIALDRDEPGWQLPEIDRIRLDIPAAENAAPLILKLHGKLPKNPGTGEPGELAWRELPPGEPLNAKQAELLETQMARVENLLPDVRRLADRPRGAFAIRWSPDFIGVLIPHVQQVRDLADLLLDDAYLQVHRRDVTTALASCHAIVSISRSLDEEPLLISQLVRIACLHHAVDGAQHVLAGGEPKADVLEALQKAFTDAERADSFSVGLRGERAGLHMLLSNLENGTLPLNIMMNGLRAGTMDQISDKLDTWTMMASLEASHAYLLRYETSALGILRLPAVEQRTRLEALDEDAKSAPALARLLAGRLSKCHEACRRTRARLRCALVALALERYRQRHGHWPAGLVNLVPEYLQAVPADPYNGEPLQYRKRENGVVVHSVGPEGKHDGTFHDQPPPQPGDSLEKYYEFRLWDVLHRGQPLARRVAMKE
jgi:hypothetical protein